MVAKLTGQKLGFQLGRLTKWITAERYRGLYNFDVQFVGEAGPRGSPSGDLYIFIHVRQHAVFGREGSNLGSGIRST